MSKKYTSDKIITVDIDSTNLGTFQDLTVLGTFNSDIIISKESPILNLNDTNTTTGTYPRIDFNTNNNQGVSIEHNELDGELPTGGYGLIIKGSPNNNQFPTTGTLSLSVLGNIYAGGTTTGTLNEVYHSGNFSKTQIDALNIKANKIKISSNDNFTGTYPVIWGAGNEDLWEANWLNVNGATDTLNTVNLSTSGNIEVGGTLTSIGRIKPNSSVFSGEGSSGNSSGPTSLGSDKGYQYTHVGGGTYSTSMSSVTGAIKISVPGGFTDRMLSFTVKIYDYTTNESFSIDIAGYPYNSGSWLNCTATITANNKNRDFTVRWGNDVGTPVVYIGELASSWSYPNIHIVNAQAGFNSSISHILDEGWNIDFESTSFATISRTQSSNLPATDWSKINDIPTSITDIDSRFLRSDVTDTMLGVLNMSNDLFILNGKALRFYRGGGDAYQRADARLDDTDKARLHWYGRTDGSVNTNFRHAWYDGASYIDVTANTGGRIDFTGSASSMYIGVNKVATENWSDGKFLLNTTDTLTGDLTVTGIGEFGGAVRITETGSAQHLLMGNQDSLGVNKPSMIRAANGILTFGVGNSWVGEGGTMTEYFRIADGGNVGIGTTNPSRTLDVVGDAQLLSSSGNTGLRIITPAGNEGYLIFGDPADNSMGGIAYNNATDSLSFDANNAERMTIDSSGNVGIGTTNPTQKLHVLGNVLASEFRPTNIVTNRIVKFDGTSLNDSSILDDGTTVTVDGNIYGDSYHFNSGTSKFRNYGAGDTQITSLISGSGFGVVLEGNDSSHIVVALKDNDINDSFAVISGGGNYTTDDTWDTTLLRIKANGATSFGGSPSTRDFNVSGVIGLFNASVEKGYINASATGVDLRLFGDNNNEVRLDARSGTVYATENITATNFIGNGSQLTNVDADTLDGFNSTQFLRDDTQYVEITVDGDADTYYPVGLDGSGEFKFGTYSISRRYNWTAPDTWNTSTHRGGLTFTFRWSGDSAWGGNDKTIRVEQFQESYTTMVAGMTLATSGGPLIVWLRGGGARYRIATPSGTSQSPETHLSGFTDTNSTVYPVRTDVSNVSSEIHSRFPVRNSSTIYDNGDRVVKATNTVELTGDVTGSGSFNSSGDISFSTTINGANHTHDNYLLNSGIETFSGNLKFNATAVSGNYATTAIELREVNNVTTSQTGHDYAPALSFHWGGRMQGKLWMNNIDGLNTLTYSSGAGSGSYPTTSMSIKTGTFVADENVIIKGAATSTDSLLKLYNTTNGSGGGIEFSDNSTQVQKGFLNFYHGDTVIGGTNYGVHWKFTTDQANLAIHIPSNGGYYVGEDKVFHEGNLTKSVIDALNIDADTLDGHHAYDFAPVTSNVTDIKAITGDTSFRNYGFFQSAQDPINFNHAATWVSGIYFSSANNSVYRKVLASGGDNDLYYANEGAGNWSDWFKLLHTGNFEAGTDYVTPTQLDAIGLATKNPTHLNDLNDDLDGGLYSITTTTLNQPTNLSADRGAVLNMRRSGSPNTFQLVIDHYSQAFVRGGDTDTDSYTNGWVQLASQDWVNTQGFLTSETDTLQGVTANGNETDKGIAVTSGKLVAGTTYVGAISKYELRHGDSTGFVASDNEGQRDLGNTLLLFNPDLTTDSFNQILFRNRSSSVANARIAAITKGLNSVDLAFTTEDNNIAAERLYIKGSGEIGVGTITPSAKLDIYDSKTKDDIYTTSVNVLHTGGVDANNRVIQAGKFEQRLNGGSNTTGTGVLGVASKQGNYGSIATGVHGLATLVGAVTVNNSDMIYRGVVGEIHMDGTNSVNLDDIAYSLYANATIETGAHLKSYYGLFLNAPTNNGTIVNKYGIYQEDGSSSNYFNGDVGIGTNNPDSPLHLYKDNIADGANTLLKLEGYTPDFALNPKKIGIEFIATDTNNTGAGDGLGARALIEMGVVNDVDYGDNDEAAGNLIFSTTDNGILTEKVIITSTGRLGVATLNPSESVEVNGNVKATKFIGLGTDITGTASGLTSGRVSVNEHTTNDIEYEMVWHNNVDQLFGSNDGTKYNPAQRRVTTGSVKSSDDGGTTGCEMKYNSTSKTMDFIFS